MPKRKRKTGMEEATGIVMGVATLVDALFLRYTGKTMQTFECHLSPSITLFS